MCQHTGTRPSTPAGLLHAPPLGSSGPRRRSEPSSSLWLNCGGLGAQGREPTLLIWPPGEILTLHQAQLLPDSEAWNATTGFTGCGLSSDWPPLGFGSGVRLPLPRHTDSTNTNLPSLAAGNGSLQLRPPLGPQQTLAIAAAAVTLCKASAQFAAAFTSALIIGATSNYSSFSLLWFATFLGWAGVWTG